MALRVSNSAWDDRWDAWEATQAKAHIFADRIALFGGDAARTLSDLPSEFVDTCLTSPPYWSARDYDHPDQLGLEHEVEEYVDGVVQVLREVRRVLVDHGTVWLNIGDTYDHVERTINGKAPATGWRRNKQLSLAPFRVALALEDDGWWIRNVVAWHKPNAMPSSVRDRLTNTWEPVFLLAKSADYYFDLDAIRVPHRTDDSIERARAERGGLNGKAKGKRELRQWLSSPRHRATVDGLKEIRRRPSAPDPVVLAAYLRKALERKGASVGWVAEQLGLPFERTRHYFRTDQIGSRLPPEETWQQLKDLLDLDDEFDEAMTVEIVDNVFKNHPKGRNPGDKISIGLASRPGQHFATMPQALADWALKATLPRGGVCLDPFMGTGTTGLSALKLGGKFIGVDIRREFIRQFADEVAGMNIQMDMEMILQS